MESKTGIFESEHAFGVTLDIPESERLALIAKVTAYSEQFISSLKDVKGFYQKTPQSLDITGERKSIDELLDIYHREVVQNGINAAAGTHLGYIPGGGVFVAALADYLAAVTNPFAGVYYASPGAAAIENEVVNWLKSVFSFPDSALGCLSSGGSISTLIAFTAARDRHQIKNERIGNSVVYLTEQVHHSTQKALRIIGLEDLIVRYIAVDSNSRMRADLLEEQILSDIASGLNPFLLVGTAGTTDTGAVDPLLDLAHISEKHRLWFHVDAAYGGFFILSSRKPLFKGIERADSLIVDPHKGLFLPYGVGAVLIKDRQAVLHSNHYVANYMQDGEAEEAGRSPSNLSPELTRHFRGLRVWFSLQYHGISPFITCLEEKLQLVKYFREHLLKMGFCLGPEPDLTVSYFWYPFKDRTNELNKLLMQKIHDDGSVFLSSTIVNQRFVIRIAVLAFRTTQETIDRALIMIRKSLNQVVEHEQSDVVKTT